MKQLPTAAEVRELVGELRLTREHFVAFGYLSEAQEMSVGIEMLLQFAELLERERWIPVTERLPEREPDPLDNLSVAVLCWGPELDEVFSGYYNFSLKRWVADAGYYLDNVTHWRLNPLPPEAE